MPVGIYISVPFCRSKCSFCNFASGVFSRDKMGAYVQRVRQEILAIEDLAATLDAKFDRQVDSLYFGGGTPTTLASDQLRDLFRAVRQNFDVQRGAEVTVECAPGTLRPEILDTLLQCGVNRISLGVQSFVDEEIRPVGRLHTAEQARADIELLMENEISNLNVDLIAGLPHQSAESWRSSLRALVESGVPHASVYILEVDDDSRLGRELIAGGTRYHAHYVPDPDLAADLYLEAIEFLAATGLHQYEISNFARYGFESRHNLKYWTRKPYLGFGLDAHSMLPVRSASTELESVRFSNTDDLGRYLAGSERPPFTPVTRQQAGEETMFLGLRLNNGVDLSALAEPEMFDSAIRDLLTLGLVERRGTNLRLTARGRLLSNDVFERFIQLESVA